MFCRVAVVFALLAASSADLFPQEKVIRLRNALIHVPADYKESAAGALSDYPTNGLALIQVEGPIEPSWRALLEASGVHLLWAVPEDAFVARLEGARAGQIAALPFVRFVGPLKPEYKIDKRLNERPLRNELSVAVLLARGAQGAEVAKTLRSFQRTRRIEKTAYGHIFEGDVNRVQLGRLAGYPFVLWIERAGKMKMFDEVSAEIVEGTNPAPGTSVQALGFNGKGVTIAVADSGLNRGDAPTMHPDLAGRVDRFFYYGALSDASDPHSHGTHVSGIVAGDGTVGERDDDGYLFGLGMAPKAHLVVQRIFDGAGIFEPAPTDEILTHDAVRAGAVIGSNSWGDDAQGEYDLTAMRFDALVRDADKDAPGDQPFIVEFSAGNAGTGERTISSPALAKNVLATGASQSDRNQFAIYNQGRDVMAEFSSRGPCVDGRIKPDLVAPGTWIASLQSSIASDHNAWRGISTNYQYQGGTSQSGPHVSGAAAIFVQYYRERNAGLTPSPALVKAALINSATDMDDAGGTGPVPNNDEGWGRVDVATLVGASRRFDFVDQTDLLSTGQVFEKTVVVANADTPFKITLTYTDVPALPMAIPALVNDLDLEVVGPNGTIYRGNQFLRGESTPNAPANDSLSSTLGS